MASEIIVQTIKGPSSGANANKIIVPSGQTLDASSGGVSLGAGTTFPSGSVVQVATTTDASNVNWSSSGWQDPWRPYFTPKHADSTLHFIVSVNVLNEASNSTDLWLGWKGLNGTYYYGFGKAGNLSGWNQNNNCVSYTVPAGSTDQGQLWIQLRGNGSATSYYNYDYGNGNARSTVTMFEVR